jgi:hypothetical protein
MQRRPSFSSLPLKEGDPHHSAWGLWGPDDQLGTLNFLTEENTLEAAKEIKEGVRVNLNWTFGEPSRPCFGRQLCEHKVRFPSRLDSCAIIKHGAARQALMVDY